MRCSALRQFTASVDASASSAVISCDLLVVGCGMMSSAFLATMMDGTEGNAAAAGGALQELGRFTVTADDAAAAAAAPSSKQAKAAAARPYALILAQQPGSSTLYAFNYLRVGAPQYFSLTAALFERVRAKQSVPRMSQRGIRARGSRSFTVFALRLCLISSPCVVLLRAVQSSAAGFAESGRLHFDRPPGPLPAAAAPTAVDCIRGRCCSCCRRCCCRTCAGA